MERTSTFRRCLRSLSLHRFRSLLSTLGVLFGVMAVVTMLSIGEGTKRQVLRQIEQLGISSIILRSVDVTEGKQKRVEGLTLAIADRLSQGPGIERIAPMRVVRADLVGAQSEFVPEILAATRDFELVKGLSLRQGRFLCDRDRVGREQVCVIGSDVARLLGVAGHIGQPLQLHRQLFRIVGILSPQQRIEGKGAAPSERDYNRTILIPLGTEVAFPSVPLRDATLSEITLRVGGIREIEPAERFVHQTLGSLNNVQVIVPKHLFQQASRARRMFNLVLGCIAAISLLVGAIGIMNIMLATVSERTREIGILRAVGATKGDVARQFLIETLVLALGGAVMGVVGGAIFSFFIAKLAGWQTAITLWSVLVSVSMALMAGLLSGLYPAVRAAALSPIEALCHH